MSYARLRHGFFKKNARHTLNASPPMLLSGGFLALIIIGTILLSLPISGTTRISVFNAFFTAASAVTITGLTVIDPYSDLTAFGQTVLTLLVQAGGLGFVTFAVLTSLALGRKLSMREQAMALQAFNQTNVSSIKRTALTVIKITIAIEAIGAVALMVWWAPEMGYGQALKHAVFHSIMGFNNAGFSILKKGLMPYDSDAIVVIVISMLIILGGIGFSVLHDLIYKRSWLRLMPYTKIIILGTLALNITGFVLLFLMEYSNPDTLANLPIHGKLLAAWMQSVTARTAGFTTIDITKMHDSSTLLVMGFMFIGGGSLSTAGGIKLGTFIILLAAMWSYITQSREVVLGKRTLEPETIQKSLALVLISTIIVFGGLFLLTVFEQLPFIDLLFEAVSALSTTGLSMDTTQLLSKPSLTVLAIMMFAGRLGPLTLIYMLATRKTSRIRYPSAEFPVG